MTGKTAAEISGFEYDWLGCDKNGYVALFSTAGAGFAPKAFLRDTDAHDRAIEAVLALPQSTEAEFFPELASGAINTWRIVAERGLYAYDCDPNGGPYCMVASPINPIRVDALPSAVSEVAVRFVHALYFKGQNTISRETLEYNDTQSISE